MRARSLLPPYSSNITQCRQKALARRCGLQALSLFHEPSSPSWQASRDHLDQMLGQQAYNTGKPDQAVQHFIRLLHGTISTSIRDDIENEQQVLDDFRLAWEALKDRAEVLTLPAPLQLPMTIFDKAKTVLTAKRGAVYQDPSTAIWKSLEEIFLSQGYPYTDSEGRLIQRPLTLLSFEGGTTTTVGCKLRNFL